MYLMYVDESGDCGLSGSPTQYYVLSGVVMHELNWKPYLDKLIKFRRLMKTMYGLGITDEIHASVFISRTSSRRLVFGIPRNKRLAILRALINEIINMSDLRIISVLVDKSGKPASYDVFEHAWTALIQRFENTIKYRNFPGEHYPSTGIIFPDNTDRKKLTRLLRKLRRYNPIPTGVPLGMGYRNLPIDIVIEDPNYRDSKDSYFVQAADLAAYFVYQLIHPCKYIKRKGAQSYYSRLAPVICKHAATSDPLGIVRL